MRNIDKFYNTISHELFVASPEQRDAFIRNGIFGELKHVRCAAGIVEVWTKVFRDDYYPTDYWTEKWILLKRIAVGKRKGDNLEDIVSRCISLIERKCDKRAFSNEFYETTLTKWV